MGEAAWVKHAKVQRSNLKNLAPLETLCVRVVIANLDYFKDKQHLFEYLPSEILQSLVDECADDISDGWFDLLAQEQLQQLSITIGEAYCAPSICGEIQAKCKRLRGLSVQLDYNKEDVIGPLASLIAELPNLQVLNLPYFRSTDKILDAITSKCSDLRCLDIYCEKADVSPKKLRGVIAKCPNLEKLGSINDEGYRWVVKEAILTLKNLRVVRFKGLQEILKELAMSGQPKLKLEEVQLYARKFNPGFPFSSLTEMLSYLHKLTLSMFREVGPDFTFSSLTEMLPCLRKLTLYEFCEVGPFLHFEHLTDLTMYRMESELMIQTYAEKLTSLKLCFCVGKIDLSMIGFLCTNLEEFNISGTQLKAKSSYKLGPKHFSELKHLHFGPYLDVSVLEEAFENVFYNMLHMLRSPKLTDVHIFSPIYILEPMLCTLIAKAREGGVVFSQVKKLFVEYGKLSANLAIKLLCTMPKLKEATLRMESRGETNRLFVGMNIFPDIILNA